MKPRPPSQYDIWFVEMEPAVGHETRKSRPCVVISNDAINHNMGTVTIIPLTRTIRNVPFRVRSTVNNLDGELMVDQIKTVDKRRLIKHLGHLDAETRSRLDSVIVRMFTGRGV